MEEEVISFALSGLNLPTSIIIGQYGFMMAHCLVSSQSSLEPIVNCG